jgi:hypothetical protein
MFWIKDRNGNLCNLALAVGIYCKPTMTDERQQLVMVDMQSCEYELFTGTREQCGCYRDELLRALKERENADLS